MARRRWKARKGVQRKETQVPIYGWKKYKLPLRIKSESEGAGGKRDGTGRDKTEL